MLKKCFDLRNLIAITICLAGLLIAGQYCMAQDYNLITLKADETEAVYALSNVQRIVFENNAMTVKMKTDADVTDVVSVRFEKSTGIENPKPDLSFFVFPNPVKDVLTVTGAHANGIINLFSLTGTLLKSIPAQESATNIDVSSLSPGLYLLRVEGKTVKFIKQ